MPATIFNTLIRWEELNTQQQTDVLLRPAMAASADISRVVTDIISDVRQQGDTALRLGGRLRNVGFGSSWRNPRLVSS